MIYDGKDFKEEIRYGLTSDTVFYGIIPANYYLEKIMIENISSNVAQLSLGSTSISGDYFIQEGITGPGRTLLVINKQPLNNTDTTLYLNSSQSGDTWNSTTLNIKFYLRRGI